MARDWRGNVRELRNVTERLVLQLGPRPGAAATALEGPGGTGPALPEQMDAVESTLIRAALADNGGNVQAAADALGIPRRTLSEKMRKHGLAGKEFR